METSFFSGSENLYKYLVTIGLLLIVMTVYYPLKEKQELEILSIKIENDLDILRYKVKGNEKNVTNLRNRISRNGNSPTTDLLILELDKLNQQNFINQLEIERKYNEIKTRRGYIRIYHWMFWLFFPIGILLTIWGFFKWKRAKKYDDNILKLENEKLELEVKKLRDESSTNPPGNV
jgi:hypothetical protein